MNTETLKAPTMNATSLKNPAVWSAVALASLSALGMLTLAQAPRAHAQAAAAPASAPKPALSVTATQATRADLALQLAANGTVAAWQEITVATQSNGLQLTELRAQVGDFVKRGQVLAVFGADTVRAELAQAQATVAESQAALALAKADAERARSLQATGALSAQQIQQLLTAEQSATARVAAANAMLQASNLRVRQATVTAPDAGIVMARPATLGSVMGAGQPLFQLIRQGRLEWRGEVPQADLAKVQAGQAVKVRPAGGGEVAGKVRLVSPTLDAQTRNALVYVDLPASPQVKAGMFARGEFTLGASSALTLPASALVLRDGFSFVMRLDGTKVALTKVQLGRRSGDRIEVTSGIQAGQSFVATGAAFLADGDTVRIVSAAK
jgi:HlyD family secretion protein